MCPEAAKAEVAALQKRGMTLELTEANSQCYVKATGIEVPSPPWGRDRQDVLIAIPGAYPDTNLDAFYIGLPYSHSGGTHERVGGTVITVAGRQWQLVSWHYPDGRSWRLGRDNIETHIVQCKGFFLKRGVRG